MKSVINRKPTWLLKKNDPLWDSAYRLLVVEGNGRQEVIEMLGLSAPTRERWFIEEVVAASSHWW